MRILWDCCRCWNGDSFCSLTRRGAQHFLPRLFLMHAYFRSTLWRNSGRHRPCRRLGHIVPLSCDLCGFCLSGTQKSSSTVRMVLNNTWKSLWIYEDQSMMQYSKRIFPDLSYYCFSISYNIYYVLHVHLLHLAIQNDTAVNIKTQETSRKWTGGPFCC